ncbi:hypothetical protein D3C84_914460 [compost metagenome]
MEINQTLQAANELDALRQSAGFDQDALDEAAQRGFGNGAFEDSEEDVGSIVEEYFPAESIEPPASTPTPVTTNKVSVAERLEAQHQSLNH